jgi:hypothetical protein
MAHLNYSVTYVQYFRYKLYLLCSISVKIVSYIQYFGENYILCAVLWIHLTCCIFGLLGLRCDMHNSDFDCCISG